MKNQFLIFIFTIAFGCSHEPGIPPLAVTSIEPAQGYPGVEIKLRGKFIELQDITDWVVRFDTAKANVISSTNEEIIVIAPPGYSNRKASVVIDHEGIVGTELATYDYLPLPEFVNMSPKKVIPDRGATLLIKNFDPALKDSLFMIIGDGYKTQSLIVESVKGDSVKVKFSSDVFTLGPVDLLLRVNKNFQILSKDFFSLHSSYEIVGEDVFNSNRVLIIQTYYRVWTKNPNNSTYLWLDNNFLENIYLDRGFIIPPTLPLSEYKMTVRVGSLDGEPLMPRQMENYSTTKVLPDEIYDITFISESYFPPNRSSFTGRGSLIVNHFSSNTALFILGGDTTFQASLNGSKFKLRSERRSGNGSGNFDNDSIKFSFGQYYYSGEKYFGYTQFYYLGIKK